MTLAVTSRRGMYILGRGCGDTKLDTALKTKPLSTKGGDQPHLGKVLSNHLLNNPAIMDVKGSRARQHFVLLPTLLHSGADVHVELWTRHGVSRMMHLERNENPAVAGSANPQDGNSSLLSEHRQFSPS